MQYRVDIKSNQCRKVAKMANNLIFWLFFAHFMHIMHTWLTVHDLYPLPYGEKHFGLPSYAISSWSEPPKSRKRPKTSFFALFCTIYAHYAYLINCAWPLTTAICWETFRTIIICNIESIRATKVEKKANVHMCTFMHIVHEPDFSRTNRRVQTLPLSCWCSMQKS